MGWYDIKNKISTPIITSDGITEILKSCLLKDGQNKIHSASIKMDNYKRPEHKEEVDESEVKKIQFNLIRYMAQSLLKDCDLSKPNLYISKIIPGWKEKNPELDITVNELKRIMSENFEIEADSITMDSNIVQDLDLDSIDAIDLIAEIQKILNCRFNAEDFKAVKTVGDIVRTVCAKVNSQC